MKLTHHLPVLLLLACPAPASEPSPLVDVTHVIPDVVLDLRYTTANNFLGVPLYPTGSRCLLRREVASRLAEAAGVLRKQGYRLRLYDCFRPRAVQWKMWERLPKPGYVADPRKGSNHNRGAAVDLTLATAEGQAVEMPTDFDTFGPPAHHGYEGGSEEGRRHRELLREAMEAAGFRKNRMEWWHYDAPGATQLPVLDEPLVATPQAQPPDAGVP